MEHTIEMPNRETPCDLVTLTHKFPLHILPLDFHGEIQVCMSLHLATRARLTSRGCQHVHCLLMHTTLG